MESFKEFYRNLVSSMSAKQLSYEVSLLVDIRDRVHWLEDCASHALYAYMYDVLVDESLSRIINCSVQPIEL